MQVIAGDIQTLRRRSGIKDGEDAFDRLHQIRPYPASVATFIKAFSSPGA